MEKNKNEIIQTAHSLFSLYGLKSVSMEDIARELKISKKTLYDHCSNKEELILLGLEHVFKNLFSEFETIMEKNDHPIVQLTFIYEQIINEIAKMEEIYVRSIQHYSLAVSEKLEQFRNETIVQFVKPLLLKARNLDNIKPEINIDLFIASYLSEIEIRYYQAKQFLPDLTSNMALKHLILSPVFGICQPNCVESISGITGDN